MNALPLIAKNIAEPLSKVDKITMYGEGNSSKLLKDIVCGTTQVTERMTQGLGIDLKSLIAGFVGGKVASNPTSVCSAPMPETQPINQNNQEDLPIEEKISTDI